MGLDEPAGHWTGQIFAKICLYGLFYRNLTPEFVSNFNHVYNSVVRAWWLWSSLLLELFSSSWQTEKSLLKMPHTDTTKRRAAEEISHRIRRSSSYNIYTQRRHWKPKSIYFLITLYNISTKQVSQSRLGPPFIKSHSGLQTLNLRLSFHV